MSDWPWISISALRPAAGNTSTTRIHRRTLHRQLLSICGRCGSNLCWLGLVKTETEKNPRGRTGLYLFRLLGPTVDTSLCTFYSTEQWTAKHTPRYQSIQLGSRFEDILPKCRRNPTENAPVAFWKRRLCTELCLAGGLPDWRHRNLWWGRGGADPVCYSVLCQIFTFQ